jgi:hypothetical protein
MAAGSPRESGANEWGRGRVTRGSAENGRYVTISDMKKDDVKAVLGRVLTWPAPAQEEAVASLRAIEDEWAGSFELSSDDREALERSADDVRQGRFADEDKVREVFGRYRRA